MGERKVEDKEGERKSRSIRRRRKEGEWRRRKEGEWIRRERIKVGG